MDATAIAMNPDVLTVADQEEGSSAQSLRNLVQDALQHYFSQLEGHDPANLYDIVLKEMEVPLLKMVLQYTRGNQSKAAIILGISRGTLRKKLAIYNLD